MRGIITPSLSLTETIQVEISRLDRMTITEVDLPHTRFKSDNLRGEEIKAERKKQCRMS